MKFVYRLNSSVRTSLEIVLSVKRPRSTQGKKAIMPAARHQYAAANVPLWANRMNQQRTARDEVSFVTLHQCSLFLPASIRMWVRSSTRDIRQDEVSMSRFSFSHLHSCISSSSIRSNCLGVVVDRHGGSTLSYFSRISLQFDEKLQRRPAVSSEPSNPPVVQVSMFLYSSDSRVALHGGRPACPANGQAILDYFGRAPAERFFRLFGKLSPFLQAQSQDLEKCTSKETRQQCQSS